MGNTTTNDSSPTGATMQVGTLLRARGGSQMVMITEVITVLRKKRKSTEKIKGYRVSSTDWTGLSLSLTMN